MITLPAGMCSDLDWKEPLTRAREERGPLVWHLDFALQEPLDEAQFLSLQFAVDHFKQEVLKTFAPAGVVVYKGPIPTRERVEFLKLLLAILPLELFLSIDCSGCKVRELLHFLASDATEDFHLIFENSSLMIKEDAPDAILLPHHPTEAFFAKVEQLLPTLGWVRFCKENRFNEQWDGVENLFFDRTLLSISGERMLKGFLAASGKLVQI